MIARFGNPLTFLVPVVMILGHMGFCHAEGSFADTLKRYRVLQRESQEIAQGIDRFEKLLDLRQRLLRDELPGNVLLSQSIGHGEYAELTREQVHRAVGQYLRSPDSLARLRESLARSRPANAEDAREFENQLNHMQHRVTDLRWRDLIAEDHIARQMLQSDLCDSMARFNLDRMRERQSQLAVKIQDTQSSLQADIAAATGMSREETTGLLELLSEHGRDVSQSEGMSERQATENHDRPESASELTLIAEQDQDEWKRLMTDVVKAFMGRDAGVEGMRISASSGFRIRLVPDSDRQNWKQATLLSQPQSVSWECIAGEGPRTTWEHKSSFVQCIVQSASRDSSGALRGTFHFRMYAKNAIPGESDQSVEGRQLVWTLKPHLSRTGLWDLLFQATTESQDEAIPESYTLYRARVVSEGETTLGEASAPIGANTQPADSQRARDLKPSTPAPETPSPQSGKLPAAYDYFDLFLPSYLTGRMKQGGSFPEGRLDAFLLARSQSNPSEGGTAAQFKSTIPEAEREIRSALLRAWNGNEKKETLDFDAQLHEAAASGKRYVVAWLLSHGAPIDTHDPKSGQTPLFVAVEKNDMEMVDLLLRAGADPDRVTVNGRTPLSLAISRNDRDLTERLQAGRIAYLAKDRGGTSSQEVSDLEAKTIASLRERRNRMSEQQLARALLHAAARGHQTLASEVVDLGIGPDVYSSLAATPLHVSIQHKHEALALDFLSRGADVYATTLTGQTALHFAARTGLDRVASKLLSLGANVDQADSSGSTPLHEACKMDSLQIAIELIAAGADPDAIDTQGYRPLHWALHSESDRLIKVLVAAGAEAEINWNPPPEPIIRNAGGESLIKRLRQDAQPVTKGNQYKLAPQPLSSIGALLHDQVFAAILVRPAVLNHRETAESLFGAAGVAAWRELLDLGYSIPDQIIVLLSERPRRHRSPLALAAEFVFQYQEPPTADTNNRSVWEPVGVGRDGNLKDWQVKKENGPRLVHIDAHTLLLTEQGSKTTHEITETRPPKNSALYSLLESSPVDLELSVVIRWEAPPTTVMRSWRAWVERDLGGLAEFSELPFQLESVVIEIERLESPEATVSLTPKPNANVEQLQRTLEQLLARLRESRIVRGSSNRSSASANPQFVRVIQQLLTEASVRRSGDAIEITSRSPANDQSDLPQVQRSIKRQPR